ncbi:MAG: glycine oxidase ThiO [Gemmatimonadaceae bacterium]|nr:glycine oxidase ThiO [Gloeobacterales cyanobacterium ES-bin-141]
MIKVCIVGGGVIGLALALELQQPGVGVTVIERGPAQGAHSAGWAAAGMLAPRAEGLAGPLLELCLRSRQLWREWAPGLEQQSGQAVDYRPSGILMPVVESNADVLRERLAVGEGEWWDRARVAAKVPGIAAGVEGGLWFGADGSVDNRKVLSALQKACRYREIEIRYGVRVLGPAVRGGRLDGVVTALGEFGADIVVLAQGSWSGEWLALPVRPLKGQMLALRASPDIGPVLFGPRVYLVPRMDGRIVVGATVEQVGFTPGNTCTGLAFLLNGAMEILPRLGECCVDETWWGFRPTTPDVAPILGAGAWPNLFLATGHHRNGILLAPITARLLARLILAGDADPLLRFFSWERFQKLPQDKPIPPQPGSAATAIPARPGPPPLHPADLAEDR